MKKLLYIIRPALILQGLLFPSLCHSQIEKQLTPAEIKQQTIVTEPVTLKKGFFRAGTIMNYRIADKYFTDKGEKEYYESNIWGSKSSYNLTFQYGISDRLEVEFATEYMNSRQESQTSEYVAALNTTRTLELKQKGTGIGDSYFKLRYQVISENNHSISLTGNINVGIPTGEKNPTEIRSAEKYDLPVGSGNFTVATGLCARTILYPYSFTGSVNYVYNFSGKKKFNVADMVEKEFRPGNMIETSLGINLHLNEWIVFSNEINYQYKGKGTINDHYTSLLPLSWSASYRPGLVFQVKKFRLGESVTIPVKGRNVAADPLYIVMIQYIF